MICIYYCDDNTVLREKYKSMIERVMCDINEELVYRDFGSGEELLAYINAGKETVDIIYQDVVMKGINGIETAKKLRRDGWHGEIIFLTSSEEFTMDPSEVGPAKYCIKSNIHEEEFREILVNTIENIRSNRNKKNVISVEHGSTEVHIFEILYFQERDGRLKVYNSQGEFNCDSTLDEIKELLANNFYSKVSEVCWVNLREVQDIGIGQIVLTGKVVVPLEEKYMEEFKGAFSDYLIQLI